MKKSVLAAIIIILAIIAIAAFWLLRGRLLPFDECAGEPDYEECKKHSAALDFCSSQYKPTSEEWKACLAQQIPNYQEPEVEIIEGIPIED